MNLDVELLDTLRANTRQYLLRAFRENGVCEGRLSDSALAAALAALALERAGRYAAAERGRDWLARHQNTDGGWGDTADSPSNLATTLLALCALQVRDGCPAVVERARTWLTARAGGLEPGNIARAVAAFYGNDKTFSGPILSVCAQSGLLGPASSAWRLVMPLPFEAAVLPHRVYKWARLPVVSYALPALIAIGLARHRQCPAAFLPWRWLRDRCAQPALHILRRIQPGSGGYLEAIPLTAFVALNLMAAGENHCPALAPCLDFLEQGQGREGGWPIDTNLATWTTSLAVRALADDDDGTDSWRTAAHDYLLGVQQRALHPFTHAAPGGWGWTNLSGAVPDADDTAAALLALRALGRTDAQTRDAAQAGIEWLLALQNRDGGMPTFCRGWLNLPFDRSCPDITAHVLAAWMAWLPDVPALTGRIRHATQRAVRYLAQARNAEGAWVPLWFGNQAAPRQENPVFGTARVLEGLAALAGDPGVDPLVEAGTAWLIRARNEDGGWGGAPGTPSSIEETALALAALAPHAPAPVLAEGVRFLAGRTHGGTAFPATPIGLYFSSLWYAEALYPVVFTAHALQALSTKKAPPRAAAPGGKT